MGINYMLMAQGEKTWNSRFDARLHLKSNASSSEFGGFELNDMSQTVPLKKIIACGNVIFVLARPEKLLLLWQL